MSERTNEVEIHVLRTGKTYRLNGRLAAIVQKLIVAREDIETDDTLHFTVHCRVKAEEVSLEIPKRY